VNGSAAGARRRAGTPRALIATTAFCLLFAIGALVWDLTDSWRTAPPIVAGQIARPTGGGIGLIDPATGKMTELVRGESNAIATAVAWSPDRSRLAYSVFHKRPEDRISSAELYVVPASGGTPTLTVPRDQPGAIVDAPAWAPDGQSIFYTYQGTENGRPVARVERAMVADGMRQQLYADGSFPDVAPDGQALTFVHDDGSGASLRIGSVNGGDAREIVPANMFAALAGPRFSPDGTLIAFTVQGQGQTPSGEVSPALGFWAMLGVPVAEAHGVPWTTWTVRPDGSDLKAVSSLQEDEPLLSWSPDGAWIAVNGGGGLWVVDARGTGDPRRVADGSIGGIDW
jgi:Tol biopolymer transport system component